MLVKNNFCYYKMKIISWNVNSIRARIIDSKTSQCTCQNRTILKTSPMGKLLQKVKADVICLQETKCSIKNLKCLDISGYHTYWNCAVKAGYSGVAIWCKTKPEKISTSLPGLPTQSKHLLKEGRILTVFFKNLVIINTYAPNTLRAGRKPVKGWKKNKPSYKYLQNRINWDRSLRKYLVTLKKKYKSIILCGDLNVARGSLDLHQGIMTQCKLAKAIDTRARQSRINILKKRAAYGIKITELGGGAGYRLEERKEFEKLLNSGFVDIYRKLYPRKYGFTYWDMMLKAFRKANNGMRIDYFIITPNLVRKVKKVVIYKEIGERDIKLPSDHAPIALFLN